MSAATKTALAIAWLAFAGQISENAALAGGQASQRPPNVIFILADDLGWGELGCYGQNERAAQGLPAIRTPRLDQMAAEGMRFTQFYCGAPVCAPSRCTLLTGKHSGHSWVRDNYEIASGPDGNYQLPLPAGTFTIGHLMKNAGYATACIGKWGLGGMETKGPTTGCPNFQGFDYFFGYLSQVQAHFYYPGHLWRNTNEVLYPENNGIEGCDNAGKTHSHNEMTREAMQFIANHARGPFFLYLAYTIPHASLQEPPHSDPTQAALGKTAVDEYYGDAQWNDRPYLCQGHATGNPRPHLAYAAMITAMDHDIGRVLDELKSLNLDDNTLVMFSSDNGTAYGSGVDYRFFDSQRGLRGLKGDVFEGGIHVPLIARWLGHIPGNTVNAHMGAFWDLMPTLADLAGEPSPADCDGVSFLSSLLGDTPSQKEHPFLYWEFAQKRHEKAVRIGDWKGVRYGDAAADAPLQLYNLAADPGETHDLAFFATNAAICQRVETIMAAEHAYNPFFFRGQDEFPVISPLRLRLSAEPSGYRLAAADSLGYVLTPMRQPARGNLEFNFALRPENSGNPQSHSAFIFGNGTNIDNLIRAGFGGAGKKLEIRCGAREASLSLPAGATAARFDNLRVSYSAGRGHVEISAGTNIVGLTLVNPIPKVTYYGYLVDHSQAVFSPASYALLENP